MNKKGFAKIIIIGIVVIFIGAAGYLALVQKPEVSSSSTTDSPQPSDISQQSQIDITKPTDIVYQNKELGIQFTYPDDMELKLFTPEECQNDILLREASCNKSLLSIKLISPVHEACREEKDFKPHDSCSKVLEARKSGNMTLIENIGITIYKNPENLSLNDWIEENTSLPKQPNCRPSESSIRGVIRYGCGNGAAWTIAFKALGQKIINIKLVTGPGMIWDKETYNQILSTFQSM